jgi:phenylalanyl-tRNA synthetase beta chain
MKGGGLLRDFEVFSVYSNAKKIGKDKVGYSLRLTYRDNEKTLTDEQTNKDVEVLLEKLNKELGIVLRT